MGNNLRPTSVPVHTWVIAYDVSDNKRRSDMAKMLSGFGVRVQFSVFECRINENEIIRLRKNIMEIGNIKEDRIRWYPICGPCCNRIIHQGLAYSNETNDDSFYLV